MLLAALSGEHILFIGPPGTAKSELGRRLSRLYNGPFFERLLTRFSVPEVRLVQTTLFCVIASYCVQLWTIHVPSLWKRTYSPVPVDLQELFGPLSMQALEDDKYVRQILGYLPAASVAFIDEIFKANSAILNTLLTILNERLFDNGTERLTVPLICLVGVHCFAVS
jgi:MoxR-like ATPase